MAEFGANIAALIGKLLNVLIENTSYGYHFTFPVFNGLMLWVEREQTPVNS